MSAKQPSDKVMLELSRRNEIGSDSTTNRIPLHITDISINTNKTVPNIGVPLSGAIRGESLNLAFDMGLSQKTISLTGVLLEQNIVKQNKDGDENRKDVNLTSFELMQLLHSYVDSSSLQDDQNISKLLFFYPSRVNNEFNYRTNVTENTPIEDLPVVPFTFKNRAYDNDFTFGTGNTIDSQSNIFDDANISNNHTGVTGFIRSFSTQIVAADFPLINFNLEFEEAKVIGDNFFD